MKNLVTKFLYDTYYHGKNQINTKGRIDLAIYEDKKPVVIIEAKRPSSSDMVSVDDLNTKATHELMLYYLQERVDHGNIDIKYLIITNTYEWFVFDASVFDNLFYKNTALMKDFIDWKSGRKARPDRDLFYNDIAKPFLKDLKEEIKFTRFDLREVEKFAKNNNPKDDSKLIDLFKILSPVHLLKQAFANDSNSLDTKFYSELLHIIGLEEKKDGGKKIILRKEKPDPASLLENTITTLIDDDKLRKLPEGGKSFGDNDNERLFNVALELCITWINRVLFLKLLEGQLLNYHSGDKAYRFLDFKNQSSFDELNKLFFEVLAKVSSKRPPAIQKKYSHIPYLNSSLFDFTSIEEDTILIKSLDDNLHLKIASSTVLKTENGKKREGELPTLQYLFEFLDAYDFSSEGKEEIQEENKTLINASVLGLIFEKINGYKDGSFFTPGFITMYMCRETIRRAVVQKFNEIKKWKLEKFEQLHNKIEEIKEANEIVNSMKICDPAVGSGHFLVSALNEIIAIKSELGILSDRKGNRLREYNVEVVNDELIISVGHEEFFEYKPGNKESQRVQEALFHEKQTIIENCLFGVDLNPNSVKICRLRLWIELLKNAYYTTESKFTELETLPNIDINIKQGNSLISRFSLEWGGIDNNAYTNCTSLVLRTNNLVNSSSFKNVFGFNESKIDDKELTIIIDKFLSGNDCVLRIGFEKVGYDFQAREILANSIGKYLLLKARTDYFKNNPLVLFIDEAHQYLNKFVKDEYFELTRLSAYDQIAKECRKYGLFLCLATQMPRDIPTGTLSQMGTFIVHRLINPYDKEAVENACSSANKNSLSFLPILGEGEAILMGIDFPMPVVMKIKKPTIEPNSKTPQFKKV